MGVWFLSTSAANKFAGTLSGLYPEPVVAVATVEKLEQESGVALFPANYDKASQKVGETPVIAMERIQLSNVKDEAAKEGLKKQVESSLVPNDKNFIGLTISNLYDFFMLFVGMAGLSSVVLFFLARRLLTMMHGVR